MPEEWTGNLIALLHNNRISITELAAALGVTKSYVSMVLNGHRNPPGMRKKLEDAAEAIIEERNK